MQSTAERRMSLLEILCRRKKDSLINLASELGVSVRTVRYDIQVLACTYPIYTEAGHDGGVFIEKWFKFGMVYMTAEQTELLRRLNETLPEQDRKIMQSILNAYTRPTDRKGDKQ